MWWLWLVLAVPVHAGPAEIGAVQGEAAIHRLIDDQIAAFRRDDADGAWKHVAPGLREKFGTAGAFLEMVRRGYPSVYRPRSYAFGPLEVTDEGLGQWLEITGPNGERVRALYLLEQQADGSWRTSGCLLFGTVPEKPAV